MLFGVTDALWAAGVNVIRWMGGPGTRLHREASDEPWAAAVEPVHDRFPGSGPLGAVVTFALKVGGGPMLMLPCDLPGLGRADVVWLLGEVAADDQRPFAGEGRPDVSWWTANALESACRAFENGERSLYAVQRTTQWRTAALPSGFDDADTPEQLPDSGTVSR